MKSLFFHNTGSLNRHLIIYKGDDGFILMISDEGKLIGIGLSDENMEELAKFIKENKQK